MIIDINIA